MDARSRAARIPLALGAALLLLGAWARPALAGSVADSVRDLGDPDAQVRSRAYGALVRGRPPEAPALLARALPGFDDVAQYYGVLVLDAYPYEASRRAWRALLDASSPYLRFAAATQLVGHGDENARPVLVAALTAPDVPQTPRLWMLARLPTASPPEALDAARSLVAPGQPIAVVAAVLRRMQIRQDRATMVRATRLLSDPRAGVRAMGAAYLLRMGLAPRADDLAKAIAAGIGLAELAVVEELLEPLARVPPVVLDAVAERLAVEPSPWIAVRWIGVLARYHDTNARPALQKLVSHRNTTVARAAFDALVALAGPLTGETLRPLLEQPSVSRRLWAAEALRRRDDDAGLPVVLLALAKGAPAERVEAARILGGFREDAAVEPLLDALEDPHVGVRTEAGKRLEGVLAALFPYRTISFAATGWAPDAPEETRRTAVGAIRAFWEAHRGRDG